MSFTKAIIAATLLALAILGFIPAAAQATSPAAPQFVTDTNYFVNGYDPVVNHTSCLDADLNTINNNGTKVQTWDCNSSEQQHWTFNAVSGVSNTYTVKNGYGRCLDAATQTIYSNGGKVQLWDCNGQPQQDWIIQPSPNGQQQVRLINLMGGLCLDANRTQAGLDGQVVQLWACNGWSNQDWAPQSP